MAMTRVEVSEELLRAMLLLPENNRILMIFESDVPHIFLLYIDMPDVAAPVDGEPVDVDLVYTRTDGVVSLAEVRVL